MSDQMPMCSDCGHFFEQNPEIGRAYRFLYDETGDFVIGREGFLSDLEEAVLDNGQDQPRDAPPAIAYALLMGGWPEPEDIQAAVLHRSLPGHAERPSHAAEGSARAARRHQHGGGMALTIYCGRCSRRYREQDFDGHPCRCDERFYVIVGTAIVVGTALIAWIAGR